MSEQLFLDLECDANKRDIEYYNLKKQQKIALQRLVEIPAQVRVLEKYIEELVDSINYDQKEKDDGIYAFDDRELDVRLAIYKKFRDRIQEDINVLLEEQEKYKKQLEEISISIKNIVEADLKDKHKKREIERLKQRIESEKNKFNKLSKEHDEKIKTYENEIAKRIN